MLCFDPLKLGLAPLQRAHRSIKARQQAGRAFSNRDVPLILIYQMGKVGSSTVHASLASALPGQPVLHLHFLSEHLAKSRQTHIEAGWNPVPYHLYLGEAVRRRLASRGRQPVRIITLVRDPIALKISALFQNPAFAGQSLRTTTGGWDTRAVVTYLESELRRPGAFDYVGGWFDQELKAVFGIDVFAQDFPKQDGYAVYKRGEVEVLLIRLEDLSRRGPVAISRFLGLDTPLALKRTNVRDETEASLAYREVLEDLSLDTGLCSEIYGSAFVQHFYGQETIERFIARWTTSASG